MAKSLDVAADSAADLIQEDQLERVREFTREPILLEGETIADLVPGTARRRAVDAAIAELDDGRETPSPEWRRRYSLLLGLERLLSTEPVHLAEGAELTEHQVDVLSGNARRAHHRARGVRSRRSLERRRRAARSNGNASGGRERRRRGQRRDEAIEDEDEDEVVPEEEEPQDWDEPAEEELVDEAPEDPGAARRFWFEHATGSGKTVAALGFIEGSRTGGVLILTHRRNLVDQFIGEISDRGYKDRLSPPLLGRTDHPYGPVTVETYQWFVRNAERISDAYAIVICDEAHTALGEKTSACIRTWPEPVFIGMTATGALIARHVADLFPTQTSRFDLAQAARRGVIAPLRCIRIPPGTRGADDRQGAAAPRRGGPGLRPGGAGQAPRPGALQRRRRRPLPLALPQDPRRRLHGRRAPRQQRRRRRSAPPGSTPSAVSGETPKRELAEILAAFERGEVDVLCNAMLLAEGWNSPRATICMHLAPTASRRVYQQRVGRVTRRAPGKEAGLVIDFVHPATTSDETIVTLHSLLDRDVYRGGAIVVGPVRRGRGRRVRVERRVVPVSADPERRLAVLERELWRIAVENLNYSEQHAWAALAGARVTANNWRRAKAMLQHDQAKELRRRFLLTCVQRNRNHQLRLKALAEIAALRDAGGVRRLGRGRRHLAARRAPRRRQGPAPGARRAPDRPPRPGAGLGLAPGGDHPRAPRGVRGPALAGDQAPARPVRQLLGPRPRPQRPPDRPRRPPAGPPPGDLAARRRGRPHAGGRGGAARRPHAHGPQALGRRPRAAPQLPAAPAPSDAAGDAASAPAGTVRTAAPTGARERKTAATRATTRPPSRLRATRTAASAFLSREKD